MHLQIFLDHSLGLGKLGIALEAMPKAYRGVHFRSVAGTPFYVPLGIWPCESTRILPPVSNFFVLIPSPRVNLSLAQAPSTPIELVPLYDT